MGTGEVYTSNEPPRPSLRASTARNIEIDSSVSTECRLQKGFRNIVLQNLFHRQTDFWKNTVLIAQSPECSELTRERVSSIFRINYRAIQPVIGHTKTNPRCWQCETLHHAISKYRNKPFRFVTEVESPCAFPFWRKAAVCEEKTDECC